MKFLKKKIILFVSHERSLNKLESFLIKNSSFEFYLLTNDKPAEYKTYTKYFKHIEISENYKINALNLPFDRIFKIICISEDLLSIAYEIEKRSKISNITLESVSTLSDKYLFYKYFKSNLPLPETIIPTTLSDFDIIKGPIFVKPNYGTGGKSPFEWGYTLWESSKKFLNYLINTNQLEEFLMKNKEGFSEKRFPLNKVRYMLQRYIDHEPIKYAPCGYINAKKVNIFFFIKMKRSLKKLDIGCVKIFDKHVWSVPTSEIDKNYYKTINHNLSTIAKSLNINNLYFSGPDYTFLDNKVFFNDFNPRPGHFMNLLDKDSENNIISRSLKNRSIVLKKHLLWGHVELPEGYIHNNLSLFHKKYYLSLESKIPSKGDKLNLSTGLQDKNSRGNICVFGKNESELFKFFNQAEKEINESLRII